MTIRAIWHNGSETTGQTYREVEDNIRSAQWVTFRSRREFRDEMRQRAFVWSGRKPKPIPIPETSHQFLESLAASGMFLLIEDREEDQ